MELWIIAALVLAAAAIGAVNRVRKSRRARLEGNRKSIYPLW